MSRRNDKKPKPGQRAAQPKQTPGKAAPATPRRSAARSFGWRAPLALAAVIAAAAGGSIYWKSHTAHSPTSAAASAQSDSGYVPKLLASATAAEAPAHANTGPAAGYVGEDSCAECHPGISEAYSHIAMGRSLYPLTADNIIEDFTSANEFYHEPSKMYFRMSHEGERFYQTSFQKDAAGQPVNEQKVEITYVVGSGNHSRSYLHREPDGAVYQLPVAWYSQEKRWAMNPGYDNAHHVNFSRRITYDCLFCHAALPDLPAGADKYNYGESAWFPEKLEAINCERCHGPAARHVELARKKAPAADVAAAIVNPANLDNQLQLEVCMQCHLETTSGNLPHSVHTVGKGILGYRPGEPLEKYRYAFDHPAGTGHDDKFEIAGQAYRMRMSPCFIKSQGRMTCTTCHDPHRVPQDRISAAIQSCLECHKPVDCTEKMELRIPVKDNCIQCHMPQRRTDDVIHAVMTDHFIQRRPPPADQLLAPRQEHSEPYRGTIAPYYPKEIDPQLKDLYLGMAYVANSADLTRGASMLKNYLDQPGHTEEFSPIYTRGVALKLLGQMDEARSALEKAITLEPKNPQAWMALGDLWEQLKDYARSTDCYRQAQQLDARLSRAFNGEGTSLLLKGDLDAARKAFEAAASKDPFDDNPHLNLAGIHLQQGDMKAAEAAARAALAINPTHADAWISLGQAALATSRPAEAAEALLRAIGLGAEDPRLFDMMLSAARQTGADPVDFFDKAHTYAPFAADVAATNLIADGPMPDLALARLQTAATQTTSPAAMPTAIRMAARYGAADLASNWARALEPLAAGNEEITLAVAMGLQAGDHEADALALLQNALAGNRTPRLINQLAWLKATAASADVADAPGAARLADEATRMLDKPNVYVLETRAAAAAAQGNFPDAIAIATQAQDMATPAEMKAEAARIQRHLADYKAGKRHTNVW